MCALWWSSSWKPTRLQHKRHSPRCINCNGNHLSTSNERPLIIKQRKIVTLAAQENILLLAARRRISSELSAPAKDIRFDYDNFPSLNNYSNSTLTHNVTKSNRFAVLNVKLDNTSINENHTYANVASSNPRRPPPIFGKKSRTLELNKPTARTSHESNKPPQDPRECFTIPQWVHPFASC